MWNVDLRLSSAEELDDILSRQSKMQTEDDMWTLRND